MTLLAPDRRTSYYKYLHPKEVLISSGVLNRSIPQVPTGRHSRHGTKQTRVVNTRRVGGEMRCC